jgi:hypothetical protein
MQPSTVNPQPARGWTTRMYDAVVYGGGVVGTAVLAPVVTYVAAPAVEYVAVPAATAVGTAIYSLPFSAPVLFGMAVSARYAIPSLISYPLSAINSSTRAVGETATAAFIGGTKSVVTFLFRRVTGAAPQRSTEAEDFVVVDDADLDNSLKIT